MYVSSSLAARQSVFGTFEFNPVVSKIDIDALVARYVDPTYWSKALKEESEGPLG
jgi:hypothetical protein